MAHTWPVSLELAVLGPVEARVDGRVVALGGSKPLIVLAGLLLRAGEVVTVDQLASWLWDGREPDNIKGAIQNYVSRLRKAIGDRYIRTDRNGYQAVVGPALDLTRFTKLATAGEDLVAAGEPRLAAARLAEALGLWRGPALSNVESDVLRRDELPALEERRLRARDNWTTAMLELGEHAAVVPELRRLVAAQPLRERPHEQLMLALHGSGRTADALVVYRKVARALSEQLGLDPGPALQRTHQAILTGDVDPFRAAPEPVVPRQLPADTGGVIGRTSELAVLLPLVPSGGLAVVEGMGGVGKTALAVHLGHLVATSFPDGQVFLDLHGCGRSGPLEPMAALAALLQAVGVASARLPRDLPGRSALWRSVTADRKLFVLLDNARASEQVRPLLPARGNLVVVTGRASMLGLAARDGAVRLPLRQFGTSDALDLLATVVGAGRVRAEPGAAEQLVRCCDLLPLAIRILGQQVNRYPDATLAAIVSEMAAEERVTLLDAFDLREGDETDLGAIFSYSYRALDAPTAWLFRLTGFFAGPDDFGPEPISAVGGVSVEKVRAGLESLVAANLLAEPRRRRYRFHDLVRTYAARLCVEYDAEHERQVLGDRLLAWYLATALNAGQLLWQDRRRYERVEANMPTTGGTFPDRDAAAAWCDEECANVVALIDSAYQWGRYAVAWQLALTFQPYLTDRGRTNDWADTSRVALAAARKLGYSRAEEALRDQQVR